MASLSAALVSSDKDMIPTLAVAVQHGQNYTPFWVRESPSSNEKQQIHIHI